ncbi:MAG: YceI family protein [Pseudomonadota bacterium]
MRNLLLATTSAALMAFGAATAQADGWTLSAEASKVAFGSIKKDTVGEAHHFSGLSGSVDENGEATIEIDVTTLETWIDIRNERMLEHVFKAVKFPNVVITTQIDMDDVKDLKPGESTTVTAEALLKFVDREIELDTDLFVLAVSDKKVLVTTDELIMVQTEELGIDSGVDKLMELASLPGITRVTPVALRLMFEKE